MLLLKFYLMKLFWIQEDIKRERIKFKLPQSELLQPVPKSRLKLNQQIKRQVIRLVIKKPQLEQSRAIRRMLQRVLILKSRLQRARVLQNQLIKLQVDQRSHLLQLLEREKCLLHHHLQQLQRERPHLHQREKHHLLLHRLERQPHLLQKRNDRMIYKYL